MAQIRIDVPDDVKKQFKLRVGNISKGLRDYMMTVITSPSQLEKIDIEQDRIKQQIKINNIGKEQLELSKIRDRIEAYEHKQLKVESERLDKQKEDLAKKSMCICCGNHIEGKRYNFPNGPVCINCVKTAGPENSVKWGLKKSKIYEKIEVKAE